MKIRKPVDLPEMRPKAIENFILKFIKKFIKSFIDEYVTSSDIILKLLSGLGKVHIVLALALFFFTRVF